MIRLILFAFLFSIYFVTKLYSQDPTNNNLLTPPGSCNEVSNFTTTVLDSSFFFNHGVVSSVSKALDNGKLENCDDYPLLLTISGFQKLINNEVLDSRNMLLKAEVLYENSKSVKKKYLIRNKVFLGLNYNLENDTLKALPYLFKARDLAAQIGDDKLRADALQNIALVYLDNKLYRKSREFVDQAVDYAIKSNNDEILAFSKLTSSRLLQEEEKYKKALRELEQAEELFRVLNQKRNQYFIEHRKGQLYEKMGKDDEAIVCLELAIELGDKIDHKLVHGLLYFKLGNLIGKNDKVKSIAYFEKAFNNHSVLNDESFEKLISTLTSHYRETKDVNKFNSMTQRLSSYYATHRDMIEVELEESSRREVATQKGIAENKMLRLKNKIGKRIAWVVAIASLICLMFAFYAYNQLNKNLKLNKKIKLQNKQLGKQNIELKNFAFMASHDLKAPAKSISSFASLLRKKESEKLDPKSLKYIDVIEKSSEDMNRLVTSLLEFSQIENSQTDFRLFSPDQLFIDVENNLFSLIEETKAQISKVDTFPNQIKGDESKLKIVFQNLISNAIKFVPEGRLPRVKISYKSDNEFHVFSIEDNGIGIEKENLDTVFLMFQRLHATSEYEGSGIGLATCKKIVLLHGGKIEIQSVVQQGTTFMVYLTKSGSAV